MTKAVMAIAAFFGVLVFIDQVITPVVAHAQTPTPVCYGLLLVPRTFNKVEPNQIILGYTDLTTARQAKAILKGEESLERKIDREAYEATPQYKIDQENKQRRRADLEKQGRIVWDSTIANSTSYFSSYGDVRIFPAPCQTK